MEREKMKNLVKIFTTGLILILLMGPTVSNAKEMNNVDRLSGSGRIETSIEISKRAYLENNTVILAGYNGQADALTGSFLAGHESAPLMLVNKNQVSESLQKELVKLKAKNIILLGGDGVISKNVENYLSQEYNVVRYSGTNRVNTAINIIKNINTSIKEVFLARGYDNLADALAIGPVSAKEGIPVLLTNTNTLPKETLDFIKDNGIKKVTVLGGEAAISKRVLNQIPENVKIDRINGKNREGTSIKIAEMYFADQNNVLVANGYSYIDALTGGYLGALTNSPLILVSKDNFTNDILKYINKDMPNATLLGGETVLSDKLMMKMQKIYDEPVDDIKPGQVEFYGDYESVILGYVNEHRKNHGIEPLALHRILVSSARYKSKSMIEHNYFNHSNPQLGGKGPDAIIWGKYNAPFNKIGENIAASYRSSGTASAKDIFDQWRNSPGHNSAMLDPKFTHIGIGIAYTSKGGSNFINLPTIIGTQHFGGN